MKDMVGTVAKNLDKAQQNLAIRVAHTFAILWYVLTSSHVTSESSL